MTEWVSKCSTGALTAARLPQSEYAGVSDWERLRRSNHVACNSMDEQGVFKVKYLFGVDLSPFRETSTESKMLLVCDHSFGWRFKARFGIISPDR